MHLWQGRRQCQDHGSAGTGGAWGQLGSTGAANTHGKGFIHDPRAGGVGSSQFLPEPEPWCSLLVRSTSGFHLPGEFTGEKKLHRAPHLPPAPHLLKVRRGERLLAPCYELPEGGDDGNVSQRARGTRWQLMPTPARSAVTPTPSCQPGPILHGRLGAAPSGTPLKKDKREDSKNKIKPAQCPIPLKTGAESGTRPSTALGAETVAGEPNDAINPCIYVMRKAQAEQIAGG